MKVSIITPAYNCEQYITESIDSIITQTYEDWELIIGDDGSTDNTRQLIDAYQDQRIRTHHVDKNSGYLQMFNYLLKQVKGEFIMSHDADDISMPNRIAAQLEVFKQFPEVGVCGTNGKLFGQGQVPILGNTETASGIIPPDYKILPFFPASIMYRREVYEKVGGFHSFFDRLSSMDQYWLYLMSKHYPIYYLNEELYLARMHPTSNHRSVSMKDIKKLASWNVYLELRRQQEQTGTDWLEQGNVAAVEKFVGSLGQDKQWLSEKYREYSAIRCDVDDVSTALTLSMQAIWLWPWASDNYRTFLYALRRTLRKR
jgi:glycosyltransferase involved in cell wall biosynthesis